MKSTAHNKKAFNGGELSPLFGARVDHIKYTTGLEYSQNAIATVHGAAERRPGTVMVSAGAEVEDKPEDAPVLVSHDIAGDEAWVYAIGKAGEDCEVFRNRAKTLVSFPSPFTAGARRTDGTSKLSRAQKGRELFLADDGSSPAAALVNNGAFPDAVPLFADAPAPDGVLSDDHPTPFVQNYDVPPFQAYEPEKRPIVEIAPSVTTGSLALNGKLIAPSGTFFNSFKRRLVFNPDDLELKNSAGAASFREWSAGVVVGNGEFVRHQGRWYQVIVTPIPGFDPTAQLNTEPLHEYGAIYSPVAGYRTQIGYVGNGHFSCQIRSNPAPVAGRPGFEEVSVRWDMVNAPIFKTSRWAWASIATGTNIEPGAAYPDNVSIWRSRLILSAGGKLFFSVAGKYRNFNQYDGSGNITADRSVSVEIPSSQLVATEWMVSQDSLIVGAKVGVFEVREATTETAFGPGNTRIDQVSTFGSHNVEAVAVDRQILYVAKGGKRLHAMGRTSEGWQSADLSVLSDHVGKDKFVELVWQNEPWRVLWAVTGAGNLVGLTWNADQDVFGWHQHRTISGDKIRGLACIPSPSGLIDDLWLSTLRFSREAAGLGVRYFCPTIERMADAHQVGGDLREAVYCDSSVSFDGSGSSGNSMGYGMQLTDGATWDEGDQLTVTRVGFVFGPAPATFQSSDVGSVLRAVDSISVNFAPFPVPDGDYVDLLIEEYVSPAVVKARPLSIVPESLRDGFVCWQFRRNSFLVPHIAGRLVDVLADGSAHPQVTADATGLVTLQGRYNVVTIGIPAWEMMKTMRIELGNETDSTQGKTKRISHTTLRFVESVGAWIGPDPEHMHEFPFRKPKDKMNAPVPAVTGDDSRPFMGNNSPDAQIVIENRQPLPMTILSVVADLISE